MRVLRRGVFVLTFLAVLGKGSASVKAETTNDFKALYDAETKKGLQELQDKYESTVGKLDEVSSELQSESDIVQSQERFNEFLKEAEKLYSQELEALDDEIWKYMERNNAIRKEIEDKFYGNIEDLLALDATYKKNVSLIELLLESKKDLKLVSGYSIDYGTVEKLEDEVAQLGSEAEVWKEAYEASKAVCELGEVTSIKFPLGKESEIRSSWGDRIDPINPGTIRFHAGVDLKASMRTPVLSIFNGTVMSTGWGPLGGYYVWVDHGDGITSYYCHLDEVVCKAGQSVSQYDQIAYSGNTGSRTTGPHLHFALYIDGVSVDPAVLFKGVSSNEE